MIHRTKEEPPIWLATRAAPVLFWASLLFLVCQAVAVVIFVDVPNLRESFTDNPAAEIEATESLDAIDPAADLPVEVPELVASGLSWEPIELATLILMGLIWPLVIAESVYHWRTRPWTRKTRRFHFYSLLYCLCPSLRMCAQSLEMGNRLWLPGWGWRRADDRLRRRLERTFSMPMIWIALMILPVLVIELWLKTQVADYRWLRIALHVSTGVIWFSFAAEFILMASVAEKKLTYLKEHWIELAIILLPLLSFMRSLRLLRATGASKLIRLSQLNQIVRTYRLRGTAMRALRALILLDLFQRLTLRAPEKTIAKLQLQLEELETEAKQIRRKIGRLERTIRKQEAEASAAESEAADLEAEVDSASSDAAGTRSATTGSV
ncbi:potassium channel protein [Rosistilla oblonga]|uniref:potassium channel protein n=1 Tax=Rosistilla oblonga TaxID=2527990 RepID=UPI003A97337C